MTKAEAIASQVVAQDLSNLSPAQRLQLAVLEDALWVIRSRGAGWKRRSARARYVQEAQAWLASDDHDPGDPFSLLAVCESLGLSAAAIRRALVEAVADPGWYATGHGGTGRRIAR